MHDKSLQLCPTLCDPIDYNLPVSSVHRILQARMLEWVAVSSSNFSSITTFYLYCCHLLIYNFNLNYFQISLLYFKLPTCHLYMESFLRFNMAKKKVSIPDLSLSPHNYYWPTLRHFNNKHGHLYSCSNQNIRCHPWLLSFPHPLYPIHSKSCRFSFACLYLDLCMYVIFQTCPVLSISTVCHSSSKSP